MPTIASTTVTVNAAFLQEIKEDNRELRQLLENIRTIFWRPKLTTRPRHVVELLGQLRDQLAMHFALEEAYGYFDDAVSVAPRLCCEAETLRSQHADMFTGICNIAEEAERLLDNDARNDTFRQIVRRFAGWYDRLQDHERREANLVLDAFNDDIGVGD